MVNVRDALYFVDDSLVVWGYDLSAIAPEDLVAVVLLGVVRGGHHDTALAAQLTNRIGDHRGRAECIVEVDLDTVCREYIGCRLSKERAIVAPVIADSYGDLFASEALQEVVGESLGSHTDGVFIHAVGASPHDAAQTARTKL